MRANGYAFKTYAPDVTELVNFSPKTQHFSMDYYIEHLSNGIELLNELMGEKDYQAFLDQTE